jgi:hypothetical protein
MTQGWLTTPMLGGSDDQPPSKSTRLRSVTYLEIALRKDKLLSIEQVHKVVLKGP